MEYTSTQWFKQVSDAKLRRALLQNMELYPIIRRKGDTYDNLGDALSRGFTWRKTSEGHQYWDRICQDMRRNPDKYINNAVKEISKKYNI